MDVRLAGYNIDCDIIAKIPQQYQEMATPETLSAAYARISRSAKHVTALRAEALAEVGKARKSNRNIVFEMGHHSVAEHAVFNFDISAVSRLAMEEIERFRLVSYTEKSQRYVTLSGDYVTPAEIVGHDLAQRFHDIVALQNQFYRQALERLLPYVFAAHPDLAKDAKQHRNLEGWAKEDARYALSLATQGQLGLTINARNAELLCRRFACSPLDEVRALGVKIYDQIKAIAPSIVLFPEPSLFERHARTVLAEAVGSVVHGTTHAHTTPVLVECTPDGDARILAGFVALAAQIDFNAALAHVSGLKVRQQRKLYREYFKHLEFYDMLSREFELADITFQATVSASNFAQLKRHRIATLLTGSYQPALGCTLPPSIRAVGLENEWRVIMRATNALYRQLQKESPGAADYILTNAHRRQVVMKMNLRELYHFVRLRADAHAQWDIRALANDLTRLVRARMPLATQLLCGKHNYAAAYAAIYKKQPQQQL